MSIGNITFFCIFFENYAVAASRRYEKIATADASCNSTIGAGPTETGQKNRRGRPLRYAVKTFGIRDYPNSGAFPDRCRGT